MVDKRLLTGKPMIVTTNTPLSVMKQAADLDGRRILEVCVCSADNPKKGVFTWQIAPAPFRSI